MNRLNFIKSLTGGSVVAAVNPTIVIPPTEDQLYKEYETLLAKNWDGLKPTDTDHGLNVVRELYFMCMLGVSKFNFCKIDNPKVILTFEQYKKARYRLKYNLPLEYIPVDIRYECIYYENTKLFHKGKKTPALLNSMNPPGVYSTYISIYAEYPIKTPIEKWRSLNVRFQCSHRHTPEYFLSKNDCKISYYEHIKGKEVILHNCIFNDRKMTLNFDYATAIPNDLHLRRFEL